MQTARTAQADRRGEGAVGIEVNIVVARSRGAALHPGADHTLGERGKRAGQLRRILLLQTARPEMHRRRRRSEGTTRGPGQGAGSAGWTADGEAFEAIVEIEGREATGR